MAGQVLRDLAIGPEILSAKDLRMRIDRAKQDGLGPHGLPAARPGAPPVDMAYAEYDRRLRASNAVDFADLLVVAVRRLERDAEGRGKLQDGFLHLLVDEFHDTNAIQYRLVWLLVDEKRNLYVVGDDGQSICGWRGARVRNILGFERDFPSAVVGLEQNYRCASRILESAAAEIERHESRRTKKLWTADAAGDPVRVIAGRDEGEEAREVARLVDELRARGRPLRSAAVFYRINAQSRVIEEAMRARGLPCVVVGGFLSYERAEVKKLLAYLRVVANLADDLSFARIVNRAASVPLAAATVADVPGVATAAACGLADLAASVERWPTAAVEGPAAVARRVFEESRYAEVLWKDRSKDAESRPQNPHELIGSIGEYEREAETPTLTGYLEQVSLQSAADEGDTAAHRIPLPRVRSARGLEFDDVFSRASRKLSSRTSRGTLTTRSVLALTFYQGGLLSFFSVRAGGRSGLAGVDTCRDAAGRDRRRRDRIPIEPRLQLATTQGAAAARQGAALAPDRRGASRPAAVAPGFLAGLVATLATTAAPKGR